MQQILTRSLIICCIVFLFFAVFCCSYPKKVHIFSSVKENVVFEGALDSFGKELSKNLSFSAVLPIDFYVAHFVDDTIPQIKNKQHKNVLWLGSLSSLDINQIKNYDVIFSSTLNLHNFLTAQGIKNFLLPIFIEKTDFSVADCVTHPQRKNCFFAVIGEQPDVISIIKEKNIKYQLFKKLDKNIKKELFNNINDISGVIVNDSTSIDGSMDTDLFFLDIIARQIPVLSDNVAKTTAMNMKNFNLTSLFDDTLSYYTYDNDIRDFFDCLDCRLEKAKKAYTLLKLRYTTKTIAKYISYILEYDQAPVPYPDDFVSIIPPIHAGLYNNGDYWLAKDLENGLNEIYDNVFLSFALSSFPHSGDVSVYLRGITPLKEKLLSPDTVSLMYLIFPFTDKQQTEDYVRSMHNEFDNADAVVSASLKVFQEAKKQGFKAYYVPQFTNQKKFYVDIDKALKSEVLFVGQNDYYRTAAPIVYNVGLPITIYGPKWQDGMAKAPYIDNKILRKYYSSAKIVLNDTRPDMRQLGFISNRIFDATACRTLVISDYMKEIEDIYGDCVPMYKNHDELIKLVEYYLKPENDEERLKKAQCAYDITLKNFTSDQAAEKFKQIIDDIKKQKNL